MNFSISRQQFNQAINTVSKAIMVNSPMPQLSGIKLDAKDDKLVLTASDSDLSMIYVIDVTSENSKLVIFEEGSLIIDARYLSEIVRKLEGDIISFELIDGTLAKLTDNHSDFNINGLKAITYPQIDFSTPEITFEINSDILQVIIQQTLFATSDKETRPVLTGVNFNYHAQEEILTAIATDSYRLAQKKIVLAGIEENFNITIPSKVLSELQRLLDLQKTVKVALNNKKIQFLFDHLVIQSRLLDGLFPETRKLIPVEFISEIKLPIKQFYNGIDRASFIKQDGVATVVLTMNQESLVMSNNNLELGSFKEILKPLNYEGRDLKISFSCRFLMEALRSIHANEVVVKFSGEMKPAVIVNPMDDSIIQLVLPVRNYD